MSRGPIHASKPGLTGDHRTDGLHCPCDPWLLADINEPGRAVVVHRPMADRFEPTDPGERVEGGEPASRGRVKPRSLPA
jgi:hypothetical protein